MAETEPSRPDASDISDELPEDLDVSGYVGPYVFPNNNRRRIPAVLYMVIAAICLAVWFGARGDDPVLVNDGILVAALALGLVGIYQFAAGYDLAVDERDALVAATREVDFAVGHASAQLGWRGLRSRPTWRILVYSAEDPPTKRGLVLVDGVVGTVLEHFVEDNPEDWSELLSPARSGPDAGDDPLAGPSDDAEPGPAEAGLDRDGAAPADGAKPES